MITIDQLLESVDLDFEPRWVTKDIDGSILIWGSKTKPVVDTENKQWESSLDDVWEFFGGIKLAEFDGKDWTECIYEVPRKTTGKIEKLEPELMEYTFDEKEYETLKMPSLENFMDKINEIIDWINDNYKDFK